MTGTVYRLRQISRVRRTDSMMCSQSVDQTTKKLMNRGSVLGGWRMIPKESMAIHLKAGTVSWCKPLIWQAYEWRLLGLSIEATLNKIVEAGMTLTERESAIQRLQRLKSEEWVRKQAHEEVSINLKGEEGEVTSEKLEERRGTGRRRD